MKYAQSDLRRRAFAVRNALRDEACARDMDDGGPENELLVTCEMERPGMYIFELIR